MPEMVAANYHLLPYLQQSSALRCGSVVTIVVTLRCRFRWASIWQVLLKHAIESDLGQYADSCKS